jgi:hypothetical protein
VSYLITMTQWLRQLPSVVMSTPEAIDEVELDHLRAVKREYAVTVRVLAVVVELLLAKVGGDTIEISDETLEASPGLNAWRVNDRRCVAITVTRED